MRDATMENAQRDEFATHAVQPEQSTSGIVSLDEIENAVTRTALNYWRMLRGGRNMPARAELSPRDMRAILHNVVLIRVIDGGRDYEYRIVGGVFAWAYGLNFQGMHLSQIEQSAPEHGARMRQLYEHVRAGAEPLGLHGWVGREVQNSPFVYYETVVLPFGDDETTVDHLLVASFHVPKAPD